MRERHFVPGIMSGFRIDHFEAPRWSRLPHGYFDARRRRRNRRVLYVALLALITSLLWATSASVSDEEIRVTAPRVQQ